MKVPEQLKGLVTYNEQEQDYEFSKEFVCIMEAFIRKHVRANTYYTFCPEEGKMEEDCYSTYLNVSDDERLL